MDAARRPRIGRWLACLGAAYAVFAAGAGSAVAAAPACGTSTASVVAVGEPAAGIAWRARLIARTPVWRSVRSRGDASQEAITPREASWLLVLRAARDPGGRCWLRVRLPSRPNDAAAWLDADRVELEPSSWRIVVSREARTLSVLRGGDLLRRFRVVIGARPTPTPRGLFSIVDVWRSNPRGFVGSHVLALTAHSDVLQEFGGGEGRVGIHGRGGSSLLDPLGSARSHGCIRLTNRAIDWLVRRAGPDGLLGTPVLVR